MEHRHDGPDRARALACIMAIAIHALAYAMISASAASGDTPPPIALPGVYHPTTTAAAPRTNTDPRMPEAWPDASTRTTAAAWLRTNGCVLPIQDLARFAQALDLTTPEAKLVLQALEQSKTTLVDGDRTQVRLADCP